MGNRTRTGSKSIFREFINPSGKAFIRQESRVDVSYTRVGQDNPRYRDMIRLGSNATNDLSVTIRDVKFTPGSLTGQQRNTIYDPWLTYRCENPCVTVAFNDSIGTELSEATSECSARFFNKLREAQRAISGPTFIGELRDTLRMLRRPASSLRDYTIAWARSTRKRTNSLKGKSLSKALSDSYLEYQFGVKPLLNDTRAACDALVRLLEDVRTTRVTAVATKQFATSIYMGEGAYIFSNIVGDRTFKRTALVAIRAGVKAQANSTARFSIDRVREVTGFNWSEFVPTVWEILPWSFVIDYFSNVGNVLTAVTTDLSQLAWYSRGTKYTKVVTWYPRKLGENTQFTIIPEQAAGGWTTSVVNITRSRNITYPSLQLQIPGIGQVSNLAALWNSLRKR